MMAGGPIDVYSRLRRTGAPSAVRRREKAFQRSGSSLPLGDHVRHPLSHRSAAQHRQLSSTSTAGYQLGFPRTLITELNGHHSRYIRHHSL